MNLAGLNVLVDGYNLELPYETGIKTYATSLCEALTCLDAKVSLLSSKRFRLTRNTILNEVLFFDRQEESFRLFDNLANLFQAGTGLFYQARKLKIKQIAIHPDTGLRDLDYNIFHTRSCYEIANFLFKVAQLSPCINPQEKIDIWHTTYPLPIRIKGAAKITTIHDLIPLKLPYTTLDNKKFFYNLVKRSIQESELIITVSQASKNDIMSIFDVDDKKICVTFQSPSLKPLEKNTEIAPRLQKYNLEYKKYILFVGTIEPKKNIGRLIEAYLGLNNLEMNLAIVGKKGWFWEEEINLPKKNSGALNRRKVKFLESVKKDDLRYLYAGAYCFVFPSLYEGFGLPPLEAMIFGCPVITSKISSLPEVCGDAALYVNPYDPDDIREKLQKLLSDVELCKTLVQLGYERVRFFSLDNYIQRLYNVYNQLR